MTVRARYAVGVLFFVVLVFFASMMPNSANGQPGELWAGQKGRYGSISSQAGLSQAGYTPFHGPDSFNGCRNALRSRGLLRIDGIPW